MNEHMNNATMIVTKAGPGSIAEAAVCGLPAIMYSFLPGQEEGNLKFVEDGGWGVYVSEPEEVR